MEIRFISSITPDDEARVAPALIDLISALLDSLPMAYTLRVETSGGTILQRTHPTLNLQGGQPNAPHSSSS